MELTITCPGCPSSVIADVMFLGRCVNAMDACVDSAPRIVLPRESKNDKPDRPRPAKRDARKNLRIHTADLKVCYSR